MIGRNVFLVFFFWLLRVEAALFAPNAGVTVFDARGISNAKSSGKYTLVGFFADWCGHCQRFAPEFARASSALRGVVEVGACSDEAVVSREGVSGYPTVRLYRPDSTYLTYSGQRSAEPLVDWVTGQLTSAVKRALAPVRTAGPAGGGAASAPRPVSQPVASGRVIALNSANFDQLVTNSRDQVWFVKFFAPWCGHCKAMAPAWSQLAREVPPNVRIGEVDATVETDLAARYRVQSYPTLKVFHPNGTVLPYSGARDASSLKSFVLAQAPPPRTLHMRDDQQFRDLCENQHTCLVAFLPHILDSSAAERKRYISDLNAVAKAVHGDTATSLRYFWVQAGDNYEREEQLRLGFGWPALVAFRKDRFAVHRGAFTPDATKSFIRSLSAASWQPLPTDLKPWADMPPWDGKDAPTEPPSNDYDDDLVVPEDNLTADEDVTARDMGGKKGDSSVSEASVSEAITEDAKVSETKLSGTPPNVSEEVSEVSKVSEEAAKSGGAGGEAGDLKITSESARDEGQKRNWVQNDEL